ncbi:arsenosugar biosynthesis radical SAM (seleno)protein ArsS [Rubritalea sp.]|uniref:arsenosugar biosynthesis radical SAM (seleno)protein ArsS n=1 Tax=Rubritalea sp. TaxID=2109375 RepID=UPI003EF50DC7
MQNFQSKLKEYDKVLKRGTFDTLQINVGRKCNQTCSHCHVEASPLRTEMMNEECAHKVGAWIKKYRPKIVDITGGAPEISQFFRYFVETAKSVGAHVIDRNNLTIIETKSHAYLPEYLAKHEVEIVASLPCYLEDNVDEQRGDGVFQKSISALRKLNAVGYGTDLPLTLVYNPIGAQLPPDQDELEADYKEELKKRYGIVFSRLFALTNLPVTRYAAFLKERGEYDDYMELLANSFNPTTVEGLMCRNTLNIGYEGEVYDCDFNQMLNYQLKKDKSLYLWDISPEDMQDVDIITANHCFGCTAGAGSSCGGTVAAV